MKIQDELKFKYGQSVKLIFRLEDVFWRKPENLTENYQKLIEETIVEVNFIGVSKRIVVRLHLANDPPIIITRPKTEIVFFALKRRSRFRGVSKI